MFQQRQKIVSKAIYVDCTPKPKKDEGSGIFDFFILFAFIAFLAIALPGFF